jgi:hypothetical protein
MAHDLDAFTPDDRIEGGGEPAALGLDQPSGGHLIGLQLPAHPACLLCDPGCRGMGGAAGEVDLARAQLVQPELTSRMQMLEGGVPE